MLTYKYLKHRREKKEKAARDVGRSPKTATNSKYDSTLHSVEKGLAGFGGVLLSAGSKVGSVGSAAIPGKKRRKQEAEERKKLREELNDLSLRLEASEASKRSMVSVIERLDFQQEQLEKKGLDIEAKSKSRIEKIEAERLRREKIREEELLRREQRREAERLRREKIREAERAQLRKERLEDIERRKTLEVQQERLQNEIENHKAAFKVFGEFQAENEEELELQIEELKRTQSELLQLNKRVTEVEEKFERFEQELDFRLQSLSTELKEFVGDIVQKIPRPTHIRKKGGMFRNTWVISFQCPCGECAESWEFETGDWKMWCKYGFVMFKTAAMMPLSLSPIATLGDGFLELWQQEGELPPQQWIKNPFLSPEQEHKLQEHLVSTPGAFCVGKKVQERDVLFYEKHFYDAQHGVFLPDTERHAKFKTCKHHII